MAELTADESVREQLARIMGEAMARCACDECRKAEQREARRDG